MPAPVFLLLRFVHVVIGVTWAGAVVFIATFLLPSVRAAGSAGSPVMAQLTHVRRLPNYLMGGVILTVLSGIALYWNDSLGFSEQWMSTGPGRTFAIGGGLGVIVAILGIAVNAPTAKRMSALGEAIRLSGGAPSAEQAAELQRLQARLLTAMRVAAVLLVLAISAMAMARYMPA